MPPDYPNPKDRTCKRALELLNRALFTFREACRVAPDFGPDSDITQMAKVVEEYMEGMGVNWKAWEEEA